MDVQRVNWYDFQRTLRTSFVVGVCIPIASLMVALLLETIVYESASGIPAVIRQDSHVTLPVCELLPNLYGCLPNVGLLTGWQVWELSQRVAQVGGLLVNLVAVTSVSVWVTLRGRIESTLPGLVVGVTGGLSALVLAWAFGVPLGVRTPWGIFAIVMLLLTPLSGWLGGRMGKARLARQQRQDKKSYFIGDEKPAAGGTVYEDLSTRELEVLALVAEGANNKEIARRLYISQATVKTHLIHVFKKLGVDNRTAAVSQALAYGLLRQKEKGDNL